MTVMQHVTPNIAPTVNKHNIYKHDNRKSTPLNDKSALNLLNKLDQGMETIVNLKSMLNVKTAEFNELIQQLTIIDQVLTSVERGAEQVELVLTDSMGTEQAKLINAEACLDSAIRSAFTLYASDNNNNSNPSINSHYSVRKEPLPIRSRSSAKYKREIILKDIEVILKYLSIDSKQYYKNINNTSNLHVLQKAYTDLNMAKTIYQSIKSNLKHRSNLIKSKNKQLYVQLKEGYVKK
ncbi:hypothetical protein BDB01DRAFT_130041 [Pilobolus umbonatus]|nr:hypothetical protein BDB01DRAFT_130041 [Pilobolus umbonatus]